MYLPGEILAGDLDAAEWEEELDAAGHFVCDGGARRRTERHASLNERSKIRTSQDLWTSGGFIGRMVDGLSCSSMSTELLKRTLSENSSASMGCRCETEWK